MKIRSIFTLVFVALLLALPMALHAQETDPETVIVAYREAVHAGEVDGALA